MWGHILTVLVFAGNVATQ